VNASGDCLKLEVQNISKDGQSGYQTGEARELGNGSFLSMPNSCSSLIELENNPFIDAEEKSPDLVVDVEDEDVAYRPVTRMS
jgi:hypothetical protein